VRAADADVREPATNGSSPVSHPAICAVRELSSRMCCRVWVGPRCGLTMGALFGCRTNGHTRDMRFLHRNRRKHRGQSVDTAKGLDAAGYDAQADLGLGTGERAVEAGDVVFGEGISVNPLSGPAYDVDRDTAS